MVLPLVLAIGGRIALPVILRLIARNRAAAIAKYGAKAVSKAVKMGRNYKGKNQSVLQAIGKVKKIIPKVKTAVKGPRGKIISKAKPKVTFKPTSKKQIAIQKKIKAKSSKKAITKGIDYTYKTATKGIRKVKKPPSKKVTIAKTQKKLVNKAVKDKIITKVDAKKILKTKPSKVTTVAKKSPKKPTKVPKKKPSKVTAATKKSPKKPTKVPKKKPSKKVTPVVTPKKGFKPGFGTGLAVGSAFSLLPFLKDKFKAPPLKPGIKDKEKIKPIIKPKPKPKRKPKPGDTPPRFPGFVPKESFTPMPSGPQVKKKFTEEREKSFEARVKALVAQKDRLKKVPAGDGVRSEYQVRMHKLKLENKKAWKKLFTIGGKLK